MNNIPFITMKVTSGSLKIYMHTRQYFASKKNPPKGHIWKNKSFVGCYLHIYRHIYNGSISVALGCYGEDWGRRIIYNIRPRKVEGRGLCITVFLVNLFTNSCNYISCFQLHSNQYKICNIYITLALTILYNYIFTVNLQVYTWQELS